MAKEVRVTVSFLVNDEFAESLQDMLANSYCWINEDWFERFPGTKIGMFPFATDLIVENN